MHAVPRLIAAGLLSLCAVPVLAQAPGGTPANRPPSAEPELPASDLLIRYESPLLRFRWSLAPEAALEPALVTDMRTEALADRQKTLRDTEASAKAVSGGRPSFQTEWLARWQPDAETDQLLAFSTRQYSFTGGAHGNVWLRGVIWDRAAGRRVAFADLFADPAAALAALKPAFCTALDAERAERRQGQKLESFEDCPDPSAYAIVPRGDGPIQSFRVLVPPYEAGPWAEGVYEIDVDAALLTKFLLPRYRPAFTNP